MPEQYVASDKRTGLEVAVTGEFPPHHDDRIRIARTTTLFTRLMSTILATENESQRRERFLAVETQLELAEALIREDMQEVQRLLRDTLQKMGITPEQMDEMARKILDQIRDNPGGLGDFELPPGDD
jgi:type II secretory pathway component PulK